MEKLIERQIEEAAEQFREMLAEQYERNLRMRAWASEEGAEGGRGGQPSAGAPPAGHRRSRSRRLRVQEAVQLWRAVFSPQSRAGRAQGSRPHLLT